MSRLIVSALVLVSLVGCVSAPKLSAQQRRSLQMRTFEGSSYANVFRGIKTVLQDEGYVISNQDMNGGLIVASVQKTDGNGAFWAAMGGNRNYRTGESFEVSFNLEEVGKNIVESRMIVQKKEQYNMGGQTGNEILDAELYQNLYRKIQVEIERRKAHGKE